ncbi:MAG: hypothetical protein KDC98_17480, partial [Planctomycetes bacterium]|nr:hypothetical protein [Planctomycetota bacterium]
MSRNHGMAWFGACALLTACNGSRVAPPITNATPAAVSIGSPVISGATDALAAELLLAGIPERTPRWHAEQAPVADELARDLDAMALDHLTSATFGSGSGPGLIGSATIRRLAAMPG